MNLYIEVLANTYPEFVRDPETAFMMGVGDVIEYQLPPIEDPEGNDTPEVYVGKLPGQEANYPAFMQFVNATNMIKFTPDK